MARVTVAVLSRATTAPVMPAITPKTTARIFRNALSRTWAASVYLRLVFRGRADQLWRRCRNSLAGAGKEWVTSHSPRVVFDRATFPIPSPLDSGFRRNDEFGAVYDDSIPFSYKSLMPAVAGTPRNENRRTGWRVLYTVPRDLGWLPDCRERGTSPRATFPIPSPLDSGFRRNDEFGAVYDDSIPFSYKSLMPAVAGTPKYEYRGAGWWVLHTVPRDLGWVPDRRELGTPPSPRVVFDRATLCCSDIDHRSRIRHISPLQFPSPAFWILAFAGSTNLGLGCEGEVLPSYERLRKPESKSVFGMPAIGTTRSIPVRQHAV